MTFGQEEDGLSLPTDRELAQMQRETEQRDLLRGGRGFLVFFRMALFVFLAVGTVLLASTYWSTFHNARGAPASFRTVLFLLLWNLIVLAMIRLVSTQLTGVKRDQEAEQSLGGDSENRAEDGTVPGAPQG